MKHKNLLKRLSGRWLLCALLTMVSVNLFAYSDFSFEGIHYNILNGGVDKTCVTAYGVTDFDGPHLSWNDVEGDLILPSNPNGYTLVGIAHSSFAYNEKLLSVTIPETVTSLDKYCFYDCSSLKSVTIPESVTSLGSECFKYCNLRPLLLKGRIRNIKSDSFKKLSGYILCRNADIEYYSKYTSLPVCDVDGPFAISLETKVCEVEVNLEKNVYGIERELNEVSLSILSSSSDEPLKTVVPDNDKCSFKDLKANTTYRIELSWKNENDEEDSYQFSFTTKGMEIKLNSSSTQATISVTSLSVNGDETFEPSEIGILFQGEKYPFTGEKLTITDLLLDNKYHVRPYVIYNEGKDEYTGQEIEIATKGWDFTAKATDERSTSVELSASFTEDDAHAEKTWWTFDGNEITGRKASIVSLAPETSDKATFNISYGDRTYSYPVEFKTTELELTTLKPKCVSNSCAIVAAQTNIAEVEPNVGFEWRKNDAPATLPSTEGYGVVCEGMLEGYIKNLQSTSFYNVRPFYKDAAGKYYYGEWITFDPSDFSYFEPTIRTYPVQAITENSAMVRGYIMPGTDDITRQGFQYWKNGGNKVRANAPMEEDITTIEVSGQLISATLDNLTPGTEYTFRVFAETAAGTIYGAEQSFTTEGTAPGENSVWELESEGNLPTVTGYYDMVGVKSATPHKGMNIVVYSDGTSKKMINH